MAICMKYSGCSGRIDSDAISRRLYDHGRAIHIVLAAKLA
jgi:hypothetical protein